MFDFIRAKLDKEWYADTICKAIVESDVEKIRKHNENHPGFMVERPIKELGCTKSESLLSIAAINDKLDMLDFLLLQGADINAKDSSSHETAIYMATAANKIEAVRFLLNQGAAINASPEIIMPACKAGNLELVKLLHAAKANMAAINKYRFGTAIMSAVAVRPNVPLIEFILTTPAIHQINAKDMRKQSALTIVCNNAFNNVNKAEYLLIAKLLIAAGATVSNVLDSHGHGYSDLYYAAKSGSLELVQLLIDNGGDYQSVNKTGHSAGMIAASFGHVHIANYLRELNLPQRPVACAGVNSVFHHEPIELTQEANCTLDVDARHIQHGL